MSQVRGNTLVSALNDMRRRLGEPALARVLAAMKPENARVIAGGLARNNWYPFDAYLDFCLTGDRVLGKGDYSHARANAAIAAEADLNIFLKVMVMVFSTPSELVQKLPTIWSKYYDSGVIVVTQDTPEQIRVELRDFPTPHALHCEIISGWVERFMQLTVARKGKTSRCSHPSCRAKGGAVCEFVVDFTR